VKLGSLLSAVAIATLAAFLTGCSRSPVAPTTSIQQGGVGPAAVGVTPDDPPPVTAGGTPMARVVTLTATDEGDVVVGRWTLRIRKNTLTMPTTIKMTVTDPEAMSVHFEVSPPEGNAFQQPAVLTANLSDVPGVDYSSWTMFKWNGDWQAEGGASSHPNQQNVVDHVVSLGDYMVGPGGGKKGKIGA